MQYRTLGRSGLRVSLAGIGTGGERQLGQRAGLSSAEQDRLVRRALELGINFFDTSSAYGDSERILGRALAGVPRDDYVIATKWPQEKFARDGREISVDPSELARGVDESLERLRVDCIDVMQFHGLRLSYYDTLVDAFAAEMDRLRVAGKVRYWGFSEWGRQDHWHEAAVRALTVHPQLWDAVMLKYNLISQSAAWEALPLAEQHGVGVIVMAAVRRHIGSPERLRALFAEWKAKGSIPADAVPDDEPLGWLVHDDVASIQAAAYKFAGSHPAVSTVLSGTANISHLAENVAALDEPRLPEADAERLAGLLGRLREPVVE